MGDVEHLVCLLAWSSVMTYRRRRGGGVGGRLKREGTYVYLQLIHVVVWQQLTQHCNYPPVKNIWKKKLISTFYKFSKFWEEAVRVDAK